MFNKPEENRRDLRQSMKYQEVCFSREIIWGYQSCIVVSGECIMQVSILGFVADANRFWTVEKAKKHIKDLLKHAWSFCSLLISLSRLTMLGW